MLKGYSFFHKGYLKESYIQVFSSPFPPSSSISNSFELSSSGVQGGDIRNKQSVSGIPTHRGQSPSNMNDQEYFPVLQELPQEAGKMKSQGPGLGM